MNAMGKSQPDNLYAKIVYRAELETDGQAPDELLEGINCVDDTLGKFVWQYVMLPVTGDCISLENVKADGGSATFDILKLANFNDFFDTPQEAIRYAMETELKSFRTLVESAEGVASMLLPMIDRPPA